MTSDDSRTAHAIVRREDLGDQGFGAMRLRDDADASADRDPIAVVHAALDAGVTMVDTADAYGNEELVGRAVRSRRDEVLLASKFGLVWHGGTAGAFDVRADPPYVRAACDASLRRLGVDVIDLYYLHHRSERTPIEETVGAMAELVTTGDVRAIGLSNVTADDLRRAHAVHPVTALQEQWSLAQRDIEDELLGAAAELGVTVVAHSPTSHGLLHRRHTDVAGDTALRAALAAVAGTHDISAGEAALAWVHHRRQAHRVRVVPLPGTTSVSHARANAAVAGLRLSPDELRRLDSASAEVRVAARG